MKKPRIPGIDLAYFVSLTILIFYGSALILSGKWTDVDMASYDIFRDTGGALFFFLAGLTIANTAASSVTSTAKYKNFLAKKGSLLFLIGIFLSPGWPMNVLVSLGIFYALTSFIIDQNKRTLWTLVIGSALGSVAFFYFLFPVLPKEPVRAVLDVSSDGFLINIVSYLVHQGYYAIIPWATVFLSGYLFGVNKKVKERNERKTLLLGLSLIGGAIALHLATMNWLPVVGYLQGNTKGKFLNFITINQPAFFLFAAGISIVILMLCIQVSSRFRGKKWLYRLQTMGGMKHSSFAIYALIGYAFDTYFSANTFFAFHWKMIGFVTILYLVYWLTNFWRRKVNKLGPIEYVFNNLNK